jgi:hypothetical protein
MNLEIEPHVFKAPFRSIIGGPSMSGKSRLLIDILKANKKYIYPPPDRIVYCYSRPQSAFTELAELNIELVEGIPEIDQFDPAINNLIILDDLMTECASNVTILNLFTVDSHHKNISTFLISQNLFAQGKHSRTISLNCNYMIVFDNPRDRSQILYLARQMYPTNSQYLIECFEDATSKTHGYLFIDLTQSTNNNLRIQSNILDNENRIVYVQKKK